VSLPGEAREGLMRAWIEILKERHPDVTWVTRGDAPAEDVASVDASADLAELLAA
jgi:hypothetical protein